MSLGSSSMARSALGTAFSLLLLTHIIQGQQNVEVFHSPKEEAIVGQNVALPCHLKNSTGLNVLNSIEWSRGGNNNTKLVVYNSGFGVQKYWPNVTIQILNDSTGSILHLLGVTKRSSGIYICGLTIFPSGSIRRQTELVIRDAEIQCDVEGHVEVHAGQNVTIRCDVLPNAQYRWTKNKTLVSENASLKLSRVTDAHAGGYTLTVNTGNKSLYKEFIITVLIATETTSLWMDYVTASPQSNVTKSGLTESAGNSRPTSTTDEHSPPPTNDTSVTWTRMATESTAHLYSSDTTITAGENGTSYAGYTQTSITSSPPPPPPPPSSSSSSSPSPSPATHTNTYYFNSTSEQEINATHTPNTSTFSDQSVASNHSTSYASTVFSSTGEMRNESMLSTMHPEMNSSASPVESSTLGSVTGNSEAASSLSVRSIVTTEEKDPDGGQTHPLLLLMIIPVLVLIAVAGFLYRKQIIKKRMDLPPPFKPPPPPVKYTAARRESSTQPYAVSRCNSVMY